MFPPNSLSEQPGGVFIGTQGPQKGSGKQKAFMVYKKAKKNQYIDMIFLNPRSQLSTTWHPKTSKRLGQAKGSYGI